MSLHRIWTGFDADVLLYLADENKNRLNAGGGPWVENDGPILQYCYFENCSLDGTLPNQRRPVTGRPRQKIVVQAYEFELSVDHIYFRKSLELPLSSIFHREQWLEIVLRLQAPENLSDKDEHTLFRAKAINFNLTAPATENVISKQKFIAEEMT